MAEREVINNRIYIDGKATDQYVCDECGFLVSDLREYGTRQVCSDCEDALEYEKEKLEELNY
jgi:hypothetical protein